MNGLKLGDLRQLGDKKDLFYGQMSKIRELGGERYFQSDEFKKVLKQIRQGKVDEVLSILESFSSEDSRIIRLYGSNHPRARLLLDWIKESDENKNWYLENVGNNFDLVENGIMILGNVWKLEDEKDNEYVKFISKHYPLWINEARIVTIDGNSYFNFDALRKVFGTLEAPNIIPNESNVVGKEDWEKLIDFLPGNYRNKIEFLLKVLGFKKAGSIYRHTLEGVGDYGHYWTKDTVTGYFYSLGITLRDGTLNFSKVSTNALLSVRCFSKKENKEEHK